MNAPNSIPIVLISKDVFKEVEGQASRLYSQMKRPHSIE